MQILIMYSSIAHWQLDIISRMLVVFNAYYMLYDVSEVHTAVWARQNVRYHIMFIIILFRVMEGIHAKHP